MNGLREDIKRIVTEACYWGKPHLSLTELAAYLDCSTRTAQRFIKYHCIRKRYLIDDNGSWVIRRTDVDAALNRRTTAL